jgi:hypothetical protein
MTNHKTHKGTSIIFKGPFKHRALKLIDNMKAYTKCGLTVAISNCENEDVSCPDCLRVEHLERKIIK